MRIFIVDDESLLRVAFNTLVDWKSLDCEVVECSNGKDAYNKFLDNPADVIVTDIKMPIMNGLELIKQINLLQKSPIIFVLSAFDDFEFVKQAFKLGITDYILKTEINTDSLLTLYKKSVEILSKNLNYSQKQYYEYNYDFFCKSILNGVEYSNYSLSDNNPCFSFCNSNSIGISIKIIQLQHILNLTTEIKDIIHNISELLINYRHMTFDSSDNTVFILICRPDNFDFHNFVSLCVNSINTYITSINKSCYIGVSGNHQKFFSLNKLYIESCYARICIFFNCKNNYFCFNSFDITTNDLQIQKKLNNLKLFLSSKEYQDTDGIICLIKNGTEKTLKQILDLYDKYCNIILNYIYFHHEMDNLIINCKSLQELLDGNTPLDNLNKLLEVILQKINDLRSHNTNYLVRLSIEYIHNHFNEDIHLSIVASKLAVSSEHLSRLFSENTGQSFSHYLSEIRVEHAKSLLSTGKYKVYEVSEQCGYSSTEHFARIFKKITGENPKNYMNKP